MTTVFYFMAILFAGLAIMIAYFNGHQIVVVHLFKLVLTIPFSVALIAFSLAPLASLLFVGLAQQQKSKKHLIRTGWKAEKVQVAHEIAQDKVAALEAKIKTLETALSESIKRHTL